MIEYWWEVMDSHPRKQPMTRVVLVDTDLAQPKTTTRVQARRITMAPNHPAGLHVHNGPVVGNVIEGSVVYQVEGHPAQTLAPGDLFVEQEGQRIARFDAGPDGVTFLAWFLLGPGEEPAILQPE